MLRPEAWEVGPLDSAGWRVLGRLRTAPPRGAVLATLGILGGVAELLVLRPFTVEWEGPLNWLAVAFGLVGGSFVACG